MITKEYLLKHAMNSQEYINKIDQKYLEKWQKKLNKAGELLKNESIFGKKLPEVNIAVISADWCGDCQNAVPILIKIAEMHSDINIYILDRDTNIDILEEYPTAGAKKIPLVLFMNKEFNEINRWIERSSFAYSLFYKAKVEAIENNTEEYRSYLSTLLKENSAKMFNENTREIMFALEKTINLINATSSIEELKKR